MITTLVVWHLFYMLSVIISAYLCTRVHLYTVLICTDGLIMGICLCLLLIAHLIYIILYIILYYIIILSILYTVHLCTDGLIMGICLCLLLIAHCAICYWLGMFHL